ncbi:MAG TPA: hypothetical protein VMG10_16355 [Gemmataceae bacterium]|nr:hypothetical protein [Gemmataceae bacterium]
MRRLLRDPSGTVRLFQEHLRPIPAIEEARIARWIADLDSVEFAVRENAMPNDSAYRIFADLVDSSLSAT